MLSLADAGGVAVIEPERLKLLINAAVTLAGRAASANSAKAYALSMGVIIKLAEMAERRRLKSETGGLIGGFDPERGRIELVGIVAAIRERIGAPADRGDSAEPVAVVRKRKPANPREHGAGRKNKRRGGPAARRRRKDAQ